MASKPASAYIYVFQDALLTKSKTKLVFGFVRVGMSRGSSKGKGFRSGRGKGGMKGTLIVWEGSLRPDFFEEPVYQFRPRARVILLKSALSENTITGRKIGQNACMVRTT